MDHKQLRAFLTIAETRNMTRAAEILNLVQPAVSRQLRLLEEDLGTQLFERERQGMVLTEAGKALFGYARRAMLELDRARAELSGSEDEVAGIVTLGMLPSTCNVLPGPILAAALQKYPKVRLRFAMGYAGTLQQWLEKGEIDAALLYGVEHEPQIQTTPLVEEPLWIVGPASAKLRKASPIKLSSLAQRPMILPNGPNGIRYLLDQACAVSKVSLQVIVETNAMDIQKSLVLSGHGYTILPPISFKQELADGRLKGAPLDAPKISRTLLLALLANRTISRPVRCVVDLMVDCIHEAVINKQWPEATWVAK